MTLADNSIFCTIFTLYFAGSPLVYSPAPRGACSNCCEIHEVQDIQFLFYTRRNPTIADYLHLNNTSSIKNHNIEINNTLILYIHGFSESVFVGKGQSSHEIRNAFLESDNYNVILVDWSPITAMPWYSSAVENIPRVGHYVARFIFALIQKQGYDKNKIHLVGFSLGAEVAGFAGQQLQEWGTLLPRITGLDPALPLLNKGSPHHHLHSTDAKFVDVIHTDGGVLGNPMPMGHADFYPNGGTPLQPGCAKQEFSQNRWIGIIIGCSHQRAWQYFAESLKYPKSFYSNNCEPFDISANSSCKSDIKAYMGIKADHRLRGKFYLKTNDKSPFGKNCHVVM